MLDRVHMIDKITLAVERGGALGDAQGADSVVDGDLDNDPGCDDKPNAVIREAAFR